MIAAYAMGGGLGHLRRTQRLLGLLAPGEEAVLLSATRFDFPDLVRVPRSLAGSRTRFADWLVGSAGQAAIAAFKVQGEPVFFPDAGR